MRPLPARPDSFLAWTADGFTGVITDGRRPSSYFMPIPKAKNKGGQLAFDGWTGDCAPGARSGGSSAVKQCERFSMTERASPTWPAAMG